MAGAIDKGHDTYNHFNDGLQARVNPLSAIDKKILNFAAKVSANPSIKTHGQILRNFGMYPPEFWTRAQNLSEHPDVDPQHKESLTSMFSAPSRPGPMGGGAPVDTESKKFSHGVEW
jgi:hypothetical protein